MNRGGLARWVQPNGYTSAKPGKGSPSLVSAVVIVSLIGATKTKKGLLINCVLDEAEYETDVKVTDENFLPPDRNNQNSPARNTADFARARIYPSRKLTGSCRLCPVPRYRSFQFWIRPQSKRVSTLKLWTPSGDRSTMVAQQSSTP
jgi:hypothetical protein